MAIQNGIDVNKLNDLIDIIRSNPEVANFKFKADAEWINGRHSRTKIQTSSGKLFTLEADEPPILLGTDKAPNPMQAVLHALGSCLIVGFVYNAAARGINVEVVELAIEGDLDIHGFLGISEEVRPGYQNIRISCNVKCDAPRETVEELWEYVQKTSPVMDIVRNEVPVHIAMEKGSEAVKMQAETEEAGEAGSSD
jgi:uncharacterized OsmC-like protein